MILYEIKEVERGLRAYLYPEDWLEITPVELIQKEDLKILSIVNESINNVLSSEDSVILGKKDNLAVLSMEEDSNIHNSRLFGLDITLSGSSVTSSTFSNCAINLYGESQVIDCLFKNCLITGEHFTISDSIINSSNVEGKIFVGNFKSNEFRFSKISCGYKCMDTVTIARNDFVHSEINIGLLNSIFSYNRFDNVKINRIVFSGDFLSIDSNKFRDCVYGKIKTEKSIYADKKYRKQINKLISSINSDILTQI